VITITCLVLSHSAQDLQERTGSSISLEATRVAEASRFSHTQPLGGSMANEEHVVLLKQGAAAWNPPSEQRRCKASFSRSIISGARAVGADEHRAPADLTSFPAFGFRPTPDIGVLFGALEEFIARIALQDVSAFLKINHGTAARQQSARPRLKSYLKHVTPFWRMNARPFE
jgi:hypothetical protein